jgi:drug/metabolite transporter (DMT)-like permease
MIPALLTVLLWSGSVVCATRAARVFGSIAANRWRLVAAIVLLSAVVAACGVAPRGSAFLWLLASGAVGLGLGDLAMYRGYELVGSRLTALLTQCLAAPIAGLLEWWWLGGHPGAGEIVWGCVALVGVALALGPGARTEAHGLRLGLGVLMGVCSAAGLATAGVLTRCAVAASDGSGLVLHGALGGLGAAWARNLGGAVAAFLAGWLLASRLGVPDSGRHERRRGRWWLLGTTLCGPVLGVACYQWALSEAPAATVQAILALVPVVVMPLAMLTEGDRPRPLAWVGAVVAVAGAAGVALAHAG